MLKDLQHQRVILFEINLFTTVELWKPGKKSENVN